VRRGEESVSSDYVLLLLCCFLLLYRQVARKT